MTLTPVLVLLVLSPLVDCSPYLSASSQRRFERAAAESGAATGAFSAQQQDPVDTRVGKGLSRKARTGTRDDYHIINFSSLFNMFRPQGQTSKADSQKSTQLQDYCKKKHNGTVINGECYEFHLDRLSFVAAVRDCNMRGAQLWTPDLGDIHLFNKIMTLMPEAAQASFEKLWINVFKKDGQFFDVDGKNVTDDHILQFDDEDRLTQDAECIVLAASQGAFYVQGGPERCAQARYSYICEYKMMKPSYSKNELKKFEVPNFSDWFKLHY